LISETFARLRSRNEKALVAYVTAGDPGLDQLPGILEALVEGGADLIEVGLPFSDPIADGPTIQASTQRALDRGVTPGDVFAALSSCRLDVPVLLMGYYNPVLRIGLSRFADLCRGAGVSGTIISDLTPEESDDWAQASREHGLDTVFLGAPTSTDERLDIVCSRSSGFVYAVSRTGVTGAGSEVPPEVSGLVSRIKSRTETPVCVGFGISRPEHVRMVCEVADGAVVGSFLVDFLAREWQSGAGRAAFVSAVRELKSATR
jgi:tryptophan synthase alpha chain